MSEAKEAHNKTNLIIVIKMNKYELIINIEWRI